MAFLQLRTFAEFTGGSYFPMTFESEIPAIMQSIEVMLRAQYNVGYEHTNNHREESLGLRSKPIFTLTQDSLPQSDCDRGASM